MPADFYLFALLINLPYNVHDCFTISSYVVWQHMSCIYIYNEVALNFRYIELLYVVRLYSRSWQFNLMPVSPHQLSLFHEHLCPVIMNPTIHVKVLTCTSISYVILTLQYTIKLSITLDFQEYGRRICLYFYSYSPTLRPRNYKPA